MKYDSSLTGSNVWSGDLEESGDDWSRGDTLHIVISPSPIVAAGNHVLRVSTPNGITAEKTFSRE